MKRYKTASGLIVDFELTANKVGRRVFGLVNPTPEAEAWFTGLSNANLAELGTKLDGYHFGVKRDGNELTVYID